MAAAEKPPEPFQYMNGHKYDRAEQSKLEIDRGAGRDTRTDSRGSLCLARVGSQFCGLQEHGDDVPHQAPPQRELKGSDPIALRAQQEAIAKEARAREEGEARAKAKAAAEEPKKP